MFYSRLLTRKRSTPPSSTSFSIRSPKKQGDGKFGDQRGAGAIVSTPSDLTKFIQALFDLKLVSQESLNKLKTFREGDIVLGMFRYPLENKTALGHTGGIDRFNAALFYFPEEKLAIAYTSNSRVYSPNDIVTGALDIYNNKPFTIPAFETVAVAPDILDKYVGVYATPEFPVKITIMREGAQLFGQTTGQSPFPLEATAENKFQFEPAGVVLEFDAAKNQATLKQRGRVIIFNREK